MIEVNKYYQAKKGNKFLVRVIGVYEERFGLIEGDTSSPIYQVLTQRQNETLYGTFEDSESFRPLCWEAETFESNFDKI